jgi:hypothetical protein
MKMRRNPFGMPVEQPVRGFPTPETLPRIIRVGKRGLQTHIYDPLNVIVGPNNQVLANGAPLCGSGYRGYAARDGSGWQRSKPVLYATGQKRSGEPAKREAHYVTCIRCVKLAQANIKRYGTFLLPDRKG